MSQVKEYYNTIDQLADMSNELIDQREKELLTNPLYVPKVEDTPLKVKLLHPLAKAPVRKSENAIGYDLHSAVDIVIPPIHKYRETQPFDLIHAVPTGIAIELPKNVYGRIAPRSGLSMHGIDTRAGVIDPDFRGEIKVLLINTGQQPVAIKKGASIAQLILERAETPNVVIVDQLSETVRNTNGFGSTGQ